MAIKKQEFYEGAALHLLARTNAITGIRYEAPFFLINNKVLVRLKYSTKGRSPWGFTFTSDEQAVLRSGGAGARLVIALVSGADGVAALSYLDYQSVAALRKGTVHIACYRKHRQHYEVNGPDGCVVGKVAPVRWQRILEG
jgi:hypothetical protein